MGWREGYIAVDWGTTNRRAWRLGPSGAPLGQMDDDLGLMAVPPGGFAAAAAQIRTRLGDLPMLLAGMVGSNRGWRETPYVPCPADLEALARSIVWMEPNQTGIVPGVSQTGAAGADVMRGEEVQVLGAIAGGQLEPDSLVCHPGTHAKWIATKGAQITSFRTMMTGELFALLGRYSILADRLEGRVAVGPAFDAGVDEALAGGDLLSGLFRIRARHLLGEGSGDEASYASGLLIGCDVRANLGQPGSVTLIGRPDLCELYGAALARAGRKSATIDGGSAFLAGIHHLTEML